MSSNTIKLTAATPIIDKPVDQLKPDPRNPRVHSKRHIRQLAKSIDAFAFIMPLLVDENNQIIAGHCRLAAARQLGLLEVPTICISHMNDQQRQAYLIADNRLTDLGSWNDSLLGEVLLELAEADLGFDIEATGFSVGEIDMLVEADMAGIVGEEVETADREEEELPQSGVAISKSGDVWKLGRHVVVCGDALDPAAYSLVMGRARANLILSDPPYNVRIKGNVSGLGKVKHREFAQASGEMSEAEFIAFLESALHNASEWSREGALHYWAMDWRHLFELITAGRAVYDEQINMCVWAKTGAGMGSFYRSQHELFTVWRKGKVAHRNNIELGRFGRFRSNVWSYPGANSFSRASDEGNLLALHPTVKPVNMLADAILDSTKRGDIVLDPFLGSGSTLIAAEKIGRCCRGIEIDPLYVDTIIRRWQNWTGEQARRQDDILFDELVKIGD